MIVALGVMLALALAVCGGLGWLTYILVIRIQLLEIELDDAENKLWGLHKENQRLAKQADDAHSNIEMILDPNKPVLF